MKKSNIFPVGSYAWSRVRINDNTYSYVKSLIVGQYYSYRALVFPSSSGTLFCLQSFHSNLWHHHNRLGASDFAKFGIEPGYANQVIGEAHVTGLKSYASYCFRCLEVFEYLKPGEHFPCWKCEV